MRIFPLLGIAMVGLVSALVTNLSGAATGTVFSATATTEHVANAPDPVRIQVLRWSSDTEREKLLAAWESDNKPKAAAAGRGGRGPARGAAAAAAPAPAAESAASTPEKRLADALNGAPTVGYLWSSEVAGYALRYAGKFDGPDGTQRIILITDRRLGEVNGRWKLNESAEPSNYNFSIIELRLNAKGQGEGRISLAGKVAPDRAAGIVGLENYETAPLVLGNVKAQAAEGHS